MNKNAEPVVKWAGGKRQLLYKIKEKLPNEFNNYYEPFIGGGAVLFGLSEQLSNKKIVINDINEQLINLYNVLKNSPIDFMNELKKIDNLHENSANQKDFYLEMRSKYNQMIMNKNDFPDVEVAAQMVYINKHCFNGLYRVNSKGLFNVPYNNKKSGNSFNENNILAVSNFFNDKSNTFMIKQGDFEESCLEAKEKDFVFFDSPYAPLKADSFEAYTKEGFSIDEHKRLANLFDNLSKKGVYCMLTNHNTEFIRSLYEEKGYRIEIVPVKRMINSDASKRTGEEVIITNY